MTIVDQPGALAADQPGFLARWWVNADLRRFGAVLFGMLVLAYITGPEGLEGNPTYGFTESVLKPRVIVFILAGAVLWVLITFWGRFVPAVRERARPVVERGQKVFEPKPVRLGSYAGLVVLAAVLPWVLSDTWQEITVDQIGTYVLLALGLNVVVGFAGLLDLGYIAFYLIGAYSAAYWSGALPLAPPIHLNPFFIIPFAVLAAMLAGVILGAPTLRLRGDYLAIVTLGFGEIIQIVATNLQGVTGGAQGVIGIHRFSFQWFGIHYI